MNALILTIALMGQVGPSIEIQQQSQTVEELKTWLLTRLIVENNFDEQKLKGVEERLDKMSERQLRILIEVYNDRVAKRDKAEAARQEFMEKQVLNEAQLNLDKAKAFRDHLSREYKQRVLQGEMEQSLVRQNIQNNNRLMMGGYRNYGGYSNYNYRGYRY